MAKVQAKSNIYCCLAWSWKKPNTKFALNNLPPLATQYAESIKCVKRVKPFYLQGLNEKVLTLNVIPSMEVLAFNPIPL